MELLLWRWSTTVQVSSLAIIALFFVVLSRSTRSSELRWWVFAWTANFVALAVALSFWYFRPEGILVPIVRGLYMGAKTAFVLLLMQGAYSLKYPGRRLLPARAVIPAFAAYTLAAGLIVSSVDVVGTVQQGLMGILMAGMVVILRRPPRDVALSWLTVGLLVRSILSLVEAAAYGLQLAPEVLGSPALRELMRTFLAAHSSFDSGTEWLIALGCVLAFSERDQRELKRYNRDLLEVQADLRKLVDRDPLTGLANRRSLPQIFDAVRSTGATLLFFDLDDFKRVNDLHGHQAGDDCLRRFAKALGECFRPTDEVVRYAGDEFLVVARGLDESSAEERVHQARRRLRAIGEDVPSVSFSVGISALRPGSDPEEALRVADESMYRAKEARQGYERSVFRFSASSGINSV
jgi:diguanylate cyclase (GGDEF)-like protein